MEIKLTDLLKKLDEALDTNLSELENRKTVLDDKFLTLTNKLDKVINTWGEEKQASYIGRVIEILDDASRNLENVAKRISKSEEPKEEPTEVSKSITEEDKVLKEIIDLGFVDSTGPKQKEAGIIMLKGTKTSRGYRIEPQGDQFMATQLNNYAIHITSPYRSTPNKLVGSKLECLNWVLQNATEHLKRMKHL